MVREKPTLRDMVLGRRGLMAVAVALAGSVLLAQAPPGSGPESRLFLAEFSLGGNLDPRYQVEHNRLAELCRPATPACAAKHFPTPLRERLALLRARPDASAPVIGHVVGLMLVPEATAFLTIVLDVETTESPARTARWMSAIGDWGYGIHIPGVRSQGDWVQVMGLPLVGDAWLPTSGTEFGAVVSPLDDAIITLRPPRGRAGRTVPPGDYLVTRVRGRVVELRAEIPTDMPCDEDAKAPKVMPPLLRADAAAFFDADGTPRFYTKYQKGC